MPPSVMTWINNGRERWEQISRPQQIALVVGTLVTIGLLVGLISWSRQTPYSVLFSNLQTQDSAAIVAQLKAQKIPYELSNGGSVISVPSTMVDDTRLTLAGAGLPSQGVVGFELFDKLNPLNMTDFTQQLDYQRGLQGELTRTIQQINGVNQAWVNIVLPQSSLYTSTQQDATASITLRMNPGSALNTDQVKAIMHLVASGVQGLKPQNVTVVDTNGNNLSDAVANSLTSTGVTVATLGTALDVQHSYESHLSQQATSMLNTVLGPGKAVVRINADLNWDQLKQQSTSYGQAPGQIANQTTNTISSTGQSGPTTTGIPGTASNLVPTPTATAGTGSGTTYTQNQATTTYDVSQVVSTLDKAPGSVQRLTVAVFVDGQFPAATLTQIQQAVANAIGLNAARGDQITVTAIPFNHTAATTAQSALAAQQQQAQQDLIWRGIALAVVALALIIFAVRASRRGKSTALSPAVSLLAEETELTDQLALAGAGTPALEAATTTEDAGVILTNQQGLQAYQLTDAEQEHQRSLKHELLELAKNHPEMISNVIMGWFDE